LVHAVCASTQCQVGQLNRDMSENHYTPWSRPNQIQANLSGGSRAIAQLSNTDGLEKMGPSPSVFLVGGGNIPLPETILCFVTAQKDEMRVSKKACSNSDLLFRQGRIF
jgi:hypothetical protein